ncbi:MAG: hypothetical protein COB81_10975 [Flavobacteriaceae bacterium]|nr:MAG: hypothetical protein COB81_10975 [Flavobacteriaceae bacterium]
MKKVSIYVVMSVLSVVMLCAACSKDDDTNDVTKTVDPGNDPNFTIVANSDAGFKNLNRKVMVFNIPIYAFEGVDDAKLLHAANVMAQYLDNDEDGEIDNSTIYNSIISNKAFLFMWKTEDDMEKMDTSNGVEFGQDLGSDETNIEWHGSGHTGSFDAALEEVWHMITNGGHERVYPDVFGSQTGSEISKAMNIARGGSFQNPPADYPADAWYTYDDETCDYNCQVGEYLYWTLTSMLGAQENRLFEIGNEWRLNTRELVKTGDPKVFSIFTNPTYVLPTVLPDGTYKH